jgi:hypothetical protein
MIAPTPTPDSATLDAMALVHAEDIDRARRTWRAALSAKSASLRVVLDATNTGEIGPATGPIADA